MEQSALSDKLFSYCLQGRVKKMKQIFEENTISPDVTNPENQTLLYISCLNGHIKVASMLLDLGADPNRRSSGGSTPTHAAAYSGCEGVLRLVVLNGGDLRLHDNLGKTPKDWAASVEGRKNRRVLEVIKTWQKIVDRDILRTQERVENGVDSVSSLLELLGMNDHAVSNIKLLPDHHGHGAFLSLPFNGLLCRGIGLASVIPLAFPAQFSIPDGESSVSYKIPACFNMEGMWWCGHRVTVKRVRSQSSDFTLNNTEDLLISEINANSHLRHPNLLMLMAVCLTSTCNSYTSAPQHWLVFEPVYLGSLHQLLHKCHVHLSVPDVARILLHIADALMYMHERGFIHCAVTSHSIHITDNLNAKLGDLSFMCRAGQNTKPVNPLPTALNRWLPPELLLGLPATFGTDVYGFCIVTSESITKKLPWAGYACEQIPEVVSGGKKSNTLPDTIPSPMKPLLANGLRYHSNKRIVTIKRISHALRSLIGGGLKSMLLRSVSAPGWGFREPAAPHVEICDGLDSDSPHSSVVLSTGRGYDVPDSKPIDPQTQAVSQNEPQIAQTLTNYGMEQNEPRNPLTNCGMEVPAFRPIQSHLECHAQQGGDVPSDRRVGRASAPLPTTTEDIWPASRPPNPTMHHGTCGHASIHPTDGNIRDMYPISPALHFPSEKSANLKPHIHDSRQASTCSSAVQARPRSSMDKLLHSKVDELANSNKNSRQRFRSLSALATAGATGSTDIYLPRSRSNSLGSIPRRTNNFSLPPPTYIEKDQHTKANAAGALLKGNVPADRMEAYPRYRSNSLGAFPRRASNLLAHAKSVSVKQHQKNEKLSAEAEGRVGDAQSEEVKVSQRCQRECNRGLEAACSRGGVSESGGKIGELASKALPTSQPKRSSTCSYSTRNPGPQTDTIRKVPTVWQNPDSIQYTYHASIGTMVNSKDLTSENVRDQPPSYNALNNKYTQRCGSLRTDTVGDTDDKVAENISTPQAKSAYHDSQAPGDIQPNRIYGSPHTVGASDGKITENKARAQAKSLDHDIQAHGRTQSQKLYGSLHTVGATDDSIAQHISTVQAQSRDPYSQAHGRAHSNRHTGSHADLRASDGKVSEHKGREGRKLLTLSMDACNFQSKSPPSATYIPDVSYDSFCEKAHRLLDCDEAVTRSDIYTYFEKPNAALERRYSVPIRGQPAGELLQSQRPGFVIEADAGVVEGVTRDDMHDEYFVRPNAPIERRYSVPLKSQPAGGQFQNKISTDPGFIIEADPDVARNEMHGKYFVKYFVKSNAPIERRYSVPLKSQPASEVLQSKRSTEPEYIEADADVASNEMHDGYLVKANAPIESRYSVPFKSQQAGELLQSKISTDPGLIIEADADVATDEMHSEYLTKPNVAIERRYSLPIKSQPAGRQFQNKRCTDPGFIEADADVARDEMQYFVDPGRVLEHIHSVPFRGQPAGQLLQSKKSTEPGFIQADVARHEMNGEYFMKANAASERYHSLPFRHQPADHLLLSKKSTDPGYIEADVDGRRDEMPANYLVKANAASERYHSVPFRGQPTDQPLSKKSTGLGYIQADDVNDGKQHSALSRQIAVDSDDMRYESDDYRKSFDQNSDCGDSMDLELVVPASVTPRQSARSLERQDIVCDSQQAAREKGQEGSDYFDLGEGQDESKNRERERKYSIGSEDLEHIFADFAQRNSIEKYSPEENQQKHRIHEGETCRYTNTVVDGAYQTNGGSFPHTQFTQRNSKDRYQSEENPQKYRIHEGQRCMYTNTVAHGAYQTNGGPFPHAHITQRNSKDRYLSEEMPPNQDAEIYRYSNAVMNDIYHKSEPISHMHSMSFNDASSNFYTAQFDHNEPENTAEKTARSSKYADSERYLYQDAMVDGICHTNGDAFSHIPSAPGTYNQSSGQDIPVRNMAAKVPQTHPTCNAATNISSRQSLQGTLPSVEGTIKQPLVQNAFNTHLQSVQHFSSDDFYPATSDFKIAMKDSIEKMTQTDSQAEDVQPNKVASPMQEETLGSSQFESCELTLTNETIPVRRASSESACDTKLFTTAWNSSQNGALAQSVDDIRDDSPATKFITAIPNIGRGISGRKPVSKFRIFSAGLLPGTIASDGCEEGIAPDVTPSKWPFTKKRLVFENVTLRKRGESTKVRNVHNNIVGTLEPSHMTADVPVSSRADTKPTNLDIIEKPGENGKLQRFHDKNVQTSEPSFFSADLPVSSYATTKATIPTTLDRIQKSGEIGKVQRFRSKNVRNSEASSAVADVAVASCADTHTVPPLSTTMDTAVQSRGRDELWKVHSKDVCTEPPTTVAKIPVTYGGTTDSLSSIPYNTDTSASSVYATVDTVTCGTDTENVAAPDVGMQEKGEKLLKERVQKAESPIPCEGGHVRTLSDGANNGIGPGATPSGWSFTKKRSYFEKSLEKPMVSRVSLDELRNPLQPLIPTSPRLAGGKTSTPVGLNLQQNDKVKCKDVSGPRCFADILKDIETSSSPILRRRHTLGVARPHIDACDTHVKKCGEKGCRIHAPRRSGDEAVVKFKSQISFKYGGKSAGALGVHNIKNIASNTGKSLETQGQDIEHMADNASKPKEVQGGHWEKIGHDDPLTHEVSHLLSNVVSLALDGVAEDLEHYDSGRSTPASVPDALDHVSEEEGLKQDTVPKGMQAVSQAPLVSGRSIDSQDSSEMQYVTDQYGVHANEHNSDEGHPRDTNVNLKSTRTGLGGQIQPAVGGNCDMPDSGKMLHTTDQYDTGMHRLDGGKEQRPSKESHMDLRASVGVNTGQDMTEGPVSYKGRNVSMTENGEMPQTTDTDSYQTHLHDSSEVHFALKSEILEIGSPGGAVPIATEPSEEGADDPYGDFSTSGVFALESEILEIGPPDGAVPIAREPSGEEGAEDQYGVFSTSGVSEEGGQDFSSLVLAEGQFDGRSGYSRDTSVWSISTEQK